MISKYPARPAALATERSKIQEITGCARMKSLSPEADHHMSVRRRVAALVVRANALLVILVATRIAISLPAVVDAKTPLYSNPSRSISMRPTEDPLDADCDLDNTSPGGKKSYGSAFEVGFGREISLFESGPRGGGRNPKYGNDYSFEGYSDDSDGGGMYDEDDLDDDDDSFFTRMEQYRERRKSISSLSGNGFNSSNYSSSNNDESPFNSLPWQQSQRRQKRNPKPKPPLIQKVQGWWMNRIDPTLQSLPKMVCRIEPTTTLKLRKTFRPLKTIVRFGADYNTQQGIWQYKSSWEDSVIGGKLTLTGNKELQLTKTWQLSVGGVEDLVTRLRMRATINLQTFQAYARVGFRTERLTPIDVLEGFTILKKVPLDGSGGNVKLEVKANVALPEPEIEYSTEAQRSVIGMGNIEVSIDEMNLLLDY